MKRMLKRRTVLRDEIKSRDGSTGWLDAIWIDQHGNWSIHSTGTICPGEIKVPFTSFSPYYGESFDAAISRIFREIDNSIAELKAGTYNSHSDVWS